MNIDIKSKVIRSRKYAVLPYSLVLGLFSAFLRIKGALSGFTERGGVVLQSYLQDLIDTLLNYD